MAQDSWDAERFEELDNEALLAEVCLAERRVLGALLNPARIAESSTTALQGVWKITGELQQELARRTGARGHGGRRPFCMDAVLIADGFAPLRRDILAHAHTEYLLPGGGGTPKAALQA